MADLKTYDIFDISPLRDFIMSHGQKQSFRRKECLVAQGAPVTKIGLVTSGAFSFSRSDYKGDHQILSLALTGEFVGAYVSANPNNRSYYNVTALCGSEVALIDLDDFTGYMDRELGIEYRLDFTKAIAVGFLLRAISYRCDSPEERYLELLNRLPGINKMISMTAIASYLGVTRETFSRMRRKLCLTPTSKTSRN